MRLTNVRPYGVGERRKTPKIIGKAGCFLASGLGQILGEKLERAAPAFRMLAPLLNCLELV
jgi:hypothetical protein